MELCNKSQQEWHFEAFTLIRRKFGIVAIYALFGVKFWPQKRRLCNFWTNIMAVGSKALNRIFLLFDNIDIEI